MRLQNSTTNRLIFATALVLILAVTACSEGESPSSNDAANDSADINDNAQPDGSIDTEQLDGPVDIAGTYDGWLKIRNEPGNISADDPGTVEITKASDDTISILIFKNDDYWDDLEMKGTMTSETVFTTDQVKWEGFTFDAAGVFNGNELKLKFANGAVGGFVGSK